MDKLKFRYLLDQLGSFTVMRYVHPNRPTVDVAVSYSTNARSSYIGFIAQHPVIYIKDAPAIAWLYMCETSMTSHVPGQVASCDQSPEWPFDQLGQPESDGMRIEHIAYTWTHPAWQTGGSDQHSRLIYAMDIARAVVMKPLYIYNLVQ